MISVIKTARVAEVAIPLHGHQRQARPAKGAPGAAAAGAQAAHQAPSAHTAPAAKDERSDALEASVSAPGGRSAASAFLPDEAGSAAGAYHAGEVDGEGAALPPGVPATYAEGYEDGHAEGMREGYRKGHEEGLAEGAEQGRRDACEVAEAQERQALALSEAIAAASQGWEREVEAGAIDIAYAAVLRIIGQTAGNRDAVVAVVRSVMEQLPERRALSIHLSPSDYALLREHMAHLPLGGATVVADERIDVGGCIVETDAGSLDGRLETQLAGLRDLLLSLHRSAGDGE